MSQPAHPIPLRRVDSAPLSFRENLLQDWSVNRLSTKSQVVMAAFRLAHACDTGAAPLPAPVAKAVTVAYKVLTTWVLGVEIPPATRIGTRFRIIHPQGVVINEHTQFGADCVVRASTTIGNVMQPDGSESNSPVFGDGVELGANVVVIGPLHIGSGVRVGAGAVVIKDIPANAVAVGNPARILETPSATTHRPAAGE